MTHSPLRPPRQSPTPMSARPRWTRRLGLRRSLHQLRLSLHLSAVNLLLRSLLQLPPSPERLLLLHHLHLRSLVLRQQLRPAPAPKKSPPPSPTS